MRAAPAALAIVVALLAAGCASPAPPASCPPDRPTPGAQDVCFASADGWSLHGAIWNANNTSAPLALLVHGLNEDHHSYDTLGQQLAARGWRVLAYDTRGQGMSTNGPNGPRHLQEFTIADVPGFARDLDAARAFAGEPSLWIGASIGANFALRAAASTNESVVLLSAGLDYQGITTSEPDAKHLGAALFVASENDPGAADAANRLGAAHAPPALVKIWKSKGHGTNMLDEETRVFVLQWIASVSHPGTAP